jgi:F-type H+-transporting ATPase subunit delta
MGVTRQDLGAARLYARAALQIALGLGATVPETTRTELEALAQLFATDDEVRGTLLNRALPPEARRHAASAAAEAAQLSPLTRRLLELLAAHDRLSLVPALAEAFGAAWNEAQGIVTAEAVSAVPLEPDERVALSGALGAALGATVDLRSRVDPTVLGGVLVNAGGCTYDGTVRGRLHALRERLAASS